MEASSVVSEGRARSRRVSFGGAQIGVVVAGAIIAIVGLFLKAFKVPSNVIYTGNTNFISVSGGRILLGAVVIALVFLVIAATTHRKGVLWGTYVFTVIAIAIAAIDAGGGFTLTLVDGGSQKANAAVGVFVALAGTIIMLIGAIAVRQSAKPAA